MKIKIAPSVLAADLSCLRDEIKDIERYEVDFLHIDIMDGHFVPNITIGPKVVDDLRKKTKLDFECHLMIESPEKYIERFIDAGSKMITLHIETVAVSAIIKQAEILHARGLKIGAALNPSTDTSKIEPVLGVCDMVLVMAVEPGFGGQEFIKDVLPKITKIRSVYKGDIGVDGGVNAETGRLAVNAGANVLAAGNFIFKAKDRLAAIEELRRFSGEMAL